MRHYLCGLGFSGLCFAVALNAQTARTDNEDCARTAKLHIAEPITPDCRSYVSTFALTNSLNAITGAPYSGTMTNSHQQASPDDLRPNVSVPGFRTMRDTMGRIRNERPAASLEPMAKPVVAAIEIDDPVAGYKYLLDPVNKVAHRVAGHAHMTRVYSPGALLTPLAPPRKGPKGETKTTENLGTQIINGVAAYGTKTTVTYPPGTYPGTQLKVTNVDESWVAVDTGVLILKKITFPTTGTDIQEMKDYSADAPNPSLFVVPSDYKIVDETGPFTITVPFARS